MVFFNFQKLNLFQCFLSKVFLIKYLNQLLSSKSNCREGWMELYSLLFSAFWSFLRCSFSFLFFCLSVSPKSRKNPFASACFSSLVFPWIMSFQLPLLISTSFSAFSSSLLLRFGATVSKNYYLTLSFYSLIVPMVLYFLLLST